MNMPFRLNNPMYKCKLRKELKLAFTQAELSVERLSLGTSKRLFTEYSIAFATQTVAWIHAD
ncbi:MAG: hypothetical protein DCF22_03155 [Leptolyngbya sp.]|nr:MAG: hypothetical protein DCF22_03155 [Leptolyngbya sp.]